MTSRFSFEPTDSLPGIQGQRPSEALVFAFHKESVVVEQTLEGPLFPRAPIIDNYPPLEIAIRLALWQHTGALARKSAMAGVLWIKNGKPTRDALPIYVSLVDLHQPTLLNNRSLLRLEDCIQAVKNSVSPLVNAPLSAIEKQVLCSMLTDVHDLKQQLSSR